MPYVQRDQVTGLVKGVYAKLQAGIAEEQLADDHSDVVAYRAVPTLSKRQRLTAMFQREGLSLAEVKAELLL